jgi:Ca-activated chloride channel family protein
MLRSYRNWFLVSAIGLTAGVWGFGRPVLEAREQEGPQVSISPRPKPVAKEEVLPKSNIRSDVNLVLIPVTVTDPMNRFVTGLEKEYFKVFEDKKQQEITQFSSDDAPLSVGLLFDCSGSMGPKLKSSREAVAQFFKTANPEDEAFLVQFHDTANLVQGFTNHLEEIQNHLQFTNSKGMTALLDAVYLGIHEMKKAKNPRKALLIISDGGDNNSRYTESEIRNLVKEGDVQIYAIGIYEPGLARPDAGGEQRPGLTHGVRGPDGRAPVPSGKPQRTAGYRR